MNLSFTRTEYENIKKSKELDEFSPAQFHAWVNSNEDLFMKGESGEFDNDLQKSEYNTLQNELAAFVKVGVWEEDKQSTIVKSEYFIREKQVDFANEITKSENGEDETITKGIYRDTALNRKLGRVGTEFGSQIEKARAGTYEDTPKNRKLGRVGQRYGAPSDSDKAKEAYRNKRDQEERSYKLSQKYSKKEESTDKKEAKKLSPKSIYPGDSYMVYDAGNPDAKPEKVKIISRKRDEGGYFDVEVEYENGEKDKWYLSDEDFIFEKI
jgi:hypothetical protein